MSAQKKRSKGEATISENTHKQQKVRVAIISETPSNTFRNNAIHKK